MAGDATTRPNTHVALFVGEHPCHRNGQKISEIAHQSHRTDLGDGLIIDHSFSSKPAAGYYNDYYEKMTTYIAIICSPAHSIDPTSSARVYRVFETSEEESVFKYMDTASSRARIGAVTTKLEINKIGIVGLGGTGSYVLDLVAKTPVTEIHLYDEDLFLQHNAFRSPGAPSIEKLKAAVPKVQYFHDLYSEMRRGIVPHAQNIDAANVDQLKALDFVFLCVDNGGSKRLMVERLQEWGTSFIDVGIGVQLIDDSLLGQIRVSTSTKDHHIADGRISFPDRGADDYSQNIQIADLNALNAALAVLRWKKLYGFYLDVENEHFSIYLTDCNTLINEDKP